MQPLEAARIVVIGLGTVAQTHLRALEEIPGADVTAGVDTDASRMLRFRGQDRPVYQSVHEASQDQAPAIVVIATPTSSHAAVCDEAARYFPEARLLVEKPAADNLTDARHVLSELAKRQSVDVAYHMAFSPEVTWGWETVQANQPELGDLLSAELFFADPYYDDFERAQAALSSSWLDSGINALSVQNRFAAITGRQSLRSLGTEQQSIFEARLTCTANGKHVDALVVTSWYVTDAAKTTRLRYASGTELLMDHTAVAAYLLRDGHVQSFFGADRSIPRRERHYRALYQWWLTEDKPTLPAETSLHLHELLLS
jgi:Oxidoreductase family, NAD-binding Rossmann fold